MFLQKTSSSVSEFNSIYLSIWATFILYQSRGLPTVSNVDISEEFKWDHDFQGVFLSAFFYGYVFSQIPAGFLALKFGPIKVFGTGVLIYSLLTFLTPVFISRGPVQTVLFRALFGLAQGFHYTPQNQIFAEVLPTELRSKYISINHSSGAIAMVFVVALSSQINHHFGWRFLFHATGLFGICWWIVWYFYVEDNRKNEIIDVSIDPEIQKKKQKKFQVTHKSLLITSPSLLAIYSTHFCRNWAYYILFSWLPTFVKTISEDQGSSWFIFMPYLVSAFSTSLCGILADKLIKSQRFPLLSVRRWLVAISFLSMSFLMVLVIIDPSPPRKFTYITLTFAVDSLTVPGYQSNILDVAPNHGGIVFGIANMSGSIAGILGVYLTGRMLTYFGSWNIIFISCITFYIIGTMIWMRYSAISRVYL